MQQQRTRNNKTTRIFSQSMPDQTVHQAPGAMAVLGWTGVFAGFGSNLWQMYTTVCAVYQMFTGNSTPTVDPRDITFDICFLIAFSFQFALLFLVFRLDTRWKKQQTGGSGNKKHHHARNYGYAAIEVVQQLGLFAIWIGLAFIIDTLGDYTFIAARTVHADAATSVFLIFLYAVALYALSTLAFVRSIEYLWAASAVKDQWQQTREQLRRPAQPKF